MTGVGLIGLPWLEATGLLVVVAAGAGGALTILGLGAPGPPRQGPRVSARFDRERDMAASLGWRWRTWVTARVALPVIGLAAGLVTGILVLAVVGVLIGTLGFRFALAGRASRRRLEMERAFLGRLRDLRDRMAIGNQSLDTALAEIGRDPGPELAHVLAPLGRGGSMVDNIVEVGARSRSPIVEYACAVLIWTRSRSLDALIDAVDDLLLPVGSAQLAVEEETAVTLTQQRAVTIAMAALMGTMFVIVVRVDAFRAYYQTFAGNLVLVAVAAIFAALVSALSVIARVQPWTRWDLQRIADEQEQLVRG